MNDFDAITETLELRGRTVVDVGCGEGALVRALRNAGAEALGVDIDVTRACEIDPAGRYLQGGAERLPLEDDSVDVALLMRSLHHVPDPHAAFPELRRAVRDLVYIAEPLPTGEFFELLRPVDDETEVRRVAQEAIAAADGFERVRMFEYDVTIPLARFENLRARVLAADPSRSGRFDEVAPDLRERFEPGDYSVPMRVDLLRAI